MFRELKERMSKRRAERRTPRDERARKRAEVDARRREHKLKHGGTGGDGFGGTG
jgi:hypothetical protein